MAKSKINWPQLSLGLAMVGGGITAASPADELLLTAVTGGAGAVAAPVQAPVTLVGGIATTIVGGVLIYKAIK